MELPFRSKGDETLRPGAMLAMRERLRQHAKVHDVVSVLAYAFDHRTRMLPFVLVDRRMSPAGVRGIGAALLDAGFAKTRIVLQTWKRKFAPSLARLDGRIPDLFMVSSMGIHSGRMKELVRDVCRIPAAERPLVIAGGPHVWYSPWDVFSADPAAPQGPDVAVTGEVYVLLELLDRLLSERGSGEPLRATFLRLKDAGATRRHPGPRLPRRPRGAPARRTGRYRRTETARRPRRASAPGARLPPPRAARAFRHARRGAALREGRAPLQPRRVDRDDLRLQVPLPVLPDPGLQPASGPGEEPGAHRRRDEAHPRGVRDPLLLRRRRQLLQPQGARRRDHRGARLHAPRRRDAARQARRVGDRGDRPRHAPDARSPAAGARRRAAGAVDGRRGHDGHARQEGAVASTRPTRPSACSSAAASTRCRCSCTTTASRSSRGRARAASSTRSSCCATRAR